MFTPVECTYVNVHFVIGIGGGGGAGGWQFSQKY